MWLRTNHASLETIVLAAIINISSNCRLRAPRALNRLSLLLFSETAVVVARAVCVACVACIASFKPTIGHINLLFEPHAITIARNPKMEWVDRLREAIPAIRAEVMPGIDLLLRPHEVYLSKSFAGGVDLAARQGAREPPWDWGILRAGTVDT